MVGLTIDEAVVQAAIRDAGSVYALPLLAFALREIYEADKAKDDKGHWTLEDYEVLGDPAAKLNPIENAVRKAAERVMAQAELRGADRGLVRRVFVPRLVRVNDEGRYVRQSARAAEFDTAERALVDDLIAARLLAIWEENGEDRIEVAHEALFTKWPTLNAILEEDLEFLIGREQLKRDLKEWLDAPAIRRRRRCCRARSSSGRKLARRAAEAALPRRAGFHRGERGSGGGAGAAPTRAARHGRRLVARGRGLRRGGLLDRRRTPGRGNRTPGRRGGAQTCE